MAQPSYATANTVVHYCKMQVVESAPPRKLVWRVTESNLSFTQVKDEWTDTNIRFELAPQGDKTHVRFTHEGLVPSDECYESCSSAWSLLVNGNLRKLMATGESQPSPF